MTKRGVPGVWTYDYYDGWVPNYMFFVAHAHNAVGRFYEVQSYGPDTSTVRINQSKEWFRAEIRRRLSWHGARAAIRTFRNRRCSSR